MSDTRRLVFAIIKFFKRQLENGGLSGETAEGVEVGIQCLEAAYDMDASETSLDVACGLLEIFQQYLAELEAGQEVTAQNKALAETLKNEGNTNMSAHNYKEALACYTKAINLDPKNAVYYCNRAAASNKLGNFRSAIQDCQTALKIDPSYCKAYGRLGLAHANMHQYEEAVKNYKKASELEPDNENYKTNWKLAQTALATAASTSSNAAASMPFDNPDLSMIFTNPNLLSMASQMLTNPTMQQVMNNILSGQIGEEGVNRLDVLIQASQQLAQQMENDNPDLVQQLRRQMGQGNGGSDSNGTGSSDKDPPPNPESGS